MTQIVGTASDASGITSVTVNGEPANGTLDWSANVTLTEGENTITVVATDNAGLTTTAAHGWCGKFIAAKSAGQEYKGCSHI